MVLLTDKYLSNCMKQLFTKLFFKSWLNFFLLIFHCKEILCTSEVKLEVFLTDVQQ